MSSENPYEPSRLNELANLRKGPFTRRSLDLTVLVVLVGVPLVFAHLWWMWLRTIFLLLWGFVYGDNPGMPILTITVVSGVIAAICAAGMIRLRRTPKRAFLWAAAFYAVPLLLYAQSFVSYRAAMFWTFMEQNGWW